MRRYASTCLVGALLACTHQTPLDDDAGAPDAGAACTPGALQCDGLTYFQCGDDGHTRLDPQSCPEACDPNAGCVTCVPHTHRCVGDRAERCTTEREWALLRDCAEWGNTCAADEGLCDDECAAPEREGAYLGCDYQVVRTPRPGTSMPTITAVVANPGDDPVQLDVIRGIEIERTLLLGARSVTPVTLPFEVIVERTRVGALDSVRLRSDRPITATQYAPFLDDGGASADASLLLPRHSLGQRYYAVSYSPVSYAMSGISRPDLAVTENSLFTARATLTIAAPADEGARVMVTPTAPIAGDAAGRVPAAAAGETFALVIAPGETVQLLPPAHPLCSREQEGWLDLGELCWRDPVHLGGGLHCATAGACEEPGYDLTGTLVVSDRPVAVFSGNECAFVPIERFACDHLEEQLPPVSTWGREHVSMAVGTDGGEGENRVRVLAAHDDSHVRVERSSGSPEDLELDAGETAELTVHGAFRVTGDAPILVAQFLVGQGLSAEPVVRGGDPSMWIVPPVEQYEVDYRISLPDTYLTDTNGAVYLLVVRPEDGSIRLDGATFAADLAAASGPWRVGVVRVEPGAHRLEAEQAFSIVAIGLADYTSFATPAGRGLQPLLF